MQNLKCESEKNENDATRMASLFSFLDEFNDSSMSTSVLFEMDTDAFKLFQLRGSSYQFTLVCMTITSILFVYYSITSFFSDAGYVLHIARHCRTLLIPLMMMYLKNMKDVQRGLITVHNTFLARHLGNILIVSLNAIVSVLLVDAAFEDLCNTHSVGADPSMFSCSYTRPDLPLVPMVAALLTVFGCPLMFKSQDVIVNVASSTWTAVSLIITVLSSDSETKESLFFYLFVVVVVVANYELAHYRVKVYKSYNVLTQVLDHMKREKEDILHQSSMLRLVIGNYIYVCMCCIYVCLCLCICVYAEALIDGCSIKLRLINTSNTYILR
jgi:hypothetical protein